MTRHNVPGGCTAQASAAIVTHSPYPMEPRARRMAEAMADHGYAVDVFALRYPGELAQESVNGVMVHRLPVMRHQGGGGMTYLAEYLAFFALVAFRLSRNDVARRYALVQVYNPPDILAFSTLPLKVLAALQPRRNIPVVLDVRDMAPELFMSRFGLGPHHRITRFLRANERWACRYADAVTVCTAHQYNVMAGRGIPSAKMTVVMNCPDEAIFEPKDVAPAASAPQDGIPYSLPNLRHDDTPRFTVLYHGGILQRYGLDVLIRAIPHMVQGIPGLSVDIYGMGDFQPAVEKLAADLGVGEIAHFHPRLPLEAMPDIIRAANVGVAPVRRDVFTDTILPTKLIEYAYVGIPAVAARTSTISEYFADDMVAYFESGDPEDLARQVVWVYRNPQAAGEMAARARRFALEHNWRADKEAYLALIDRLIG